MVGVEDGKGGYFGYEIVLFWDGKKLVFEEKVRRYRGEPTKNIGVVEERREESSGSSLSCRKRF